MNKSKIQKQFGIVARQTLTSWEQGKSVPNEKKIKKLFELGIDVTPYVLPTIKKFSSYLLKPIENNNDKQDNSQE